MAVVTLVSATGAPGVTTSALGLTLQWPRDVLLVDADRHPAQALQAGYLMGHDLGGRGMAALASAHRERRDLAEELWLQTVVVATEPHERRVLPGFPTPAAAALFGQVWPQLADAFDVVGRGGCDVVVDAGRIGTDGPDPALLRVSDLVLVVTGSSLRSLASVRLHLPTLQAALEGQSSQLGLLLVGPGRPYSAGEIGRQFDCPVMGEVAWHPRHAAVLSDGEPAPRGFGQGVFQRSLRSAASGLDGALRRREELVGKGAA